MLCVVLCVVHGVGHADLRTALSVEDVYTCLACLQQCVNVVLNTTLQGNIQCVFVCVLIWTDASSLLLSFLRPSFLTHCEACWKTNTMHLCYTTIEHKCSSSMPTQPTHFQSYHLQGANGPRPISEESAYGRQTRLRQDAHTATNKF